MRRRCHGRRAGQVFLLLSPVLVLPSCVWSASVPTGYTWYESNPDPELTWTGPAGLTLDEGGKGKAVGLPVWSGVGVCGSDGMTHYDGDLTWSSRATWGTLVEITLTFDGGQEDVIVYPYVNDGPIGATPDWRNVTIAPCGIGEQGSEVVWGSPELWEELT